MYGFTLAAHGIVRWLVLLAGMMVCVRSFIAWRGGRKWIRSDERLHSAFVGCVDLQFSLGVLLYGFLSPLPEAFFADIAGSMKVPTLRFFILDHAVTMLAVVVLIHVGRSRSKRAPTDQRRHRAVWITTAIAFLIIAATIPWPGLPYGRPLLRPFGF
jgi:hypothetical protein